MTPSQTPDFSFERNGKRIIAWFSPSPLKGSEGKLGYISFIRECETEMEAILLLDYLNQFNWLMRKHWYTEGYDAKKRREQNWML